MIPRLRMYETFESTSSCPTMVRIFTSVSSSFCSASISSGEISDLIIFGTHIGLGFLLSLRECCRVTTALVWFGFQLLSGSLGSLALGIFPMFSKERGIKHLLKSPMYFVFKYLDLKFGYPL